MWKRVFSFESLAKVQRVGINGSGVEDEYLFRWFHGSVVVLYGWRIGG